MPRDIPWAVVLTPESTENLRPGAPMQLRVQTAGGVAAMFTNGTLSETERRYAIEILTVLARDAEREVREAISEHVKHSPLLPVSIARALAHDIESVALPIIRYSAVLTDADLIALVRIGNPAKSLAVASRPAVSPVVADALIDTGSKPVIGALLGNAGASIAERSYRKVLDGFEADTDICGLIADRPDLPFGIVERLVSCVSDALRERLVARHNLPPQLIDGLSLHGRERALVRCIGPVATLPRAERIAGSLNEKNLLTPTFMLRVLCAGELVLFTACLSALADLPAVDGPAQVLGDRDGARQLFEKAGLPSELIPAFRVALNRVRAIRDGMPQGWRAEHTRQIVKDLVMAYDELAPGHLENVLAQLDRLVATRQKRRLRQTSETQPIPWMQTLSRHA